jgi:hypothetical protein
MRIVQLRQADMRRVPLVEEPRLRLLSGADSVYNLARSALHSGQKLSAVIQQSLTAETLDYDPVYFGTSSWRLLSLIDHPIVGDCIKAGAAHDG